MPIEISLRENAVEKMLERRGYTVDERGYINDEDGRVESNLGNEVKIEDLGGLGNGSEIFVEDNFASAAKFAEHKAGIDRES